jgi:hypothetical protein
MIYNAIIKAVILAGFDLEKVVYQPPAKPSAKGLLAPYGSAIGDYYIRFRKSDRGSAGLSAYSEIDEERYERIIIDSVKKLIGKIGEPVAYSTIVNSYPVIYEELKKSGVLFSAPESIETILKRNLNKDFVLIDVRDTKGKLLGQKWWLKGVLFLDRVPLSERIEAMTMDVLNSEIKVTFDEVLRQVYLKFTNALTPNTQSVKQALEDCAEKTPEGQWRLKQTVRQRESEHNLMVERLAKLGKKAGFEVYADLDNWRNGLKLNLPQDRLERIREIDVVWYNPNGITHEFEVENTTGITEAIVRGSNIEDERTKRYILIPEEREDFFYRKISEPMVKEKVEKFGWKFIFYDELKSFDEAHQKRHQIDHREIEKLAREPKRKINDVQKSLDSFSIV